MDAKPRMDIGLMLLGFERAVGRFLNFQSLDLVEAFRLGQEYPDHLDFVELFRTKLRSPSSEEENLEEELPTADRFLALFEALNWGVSLDDRLTEDWPFDGIRFGDYWCDEFAGGGLIRGLRHARNIVHHDWSLALDIDPLEVFLQPRVELLWLCWVSNLEGGRSNPKGECAFQESLASRVVGDTLIEISKLFAAGVTLAIGQPLTPLNGPARIKRSSEDRYTFEEDF